MNQSLFNTTPALQPPPGVVSNLEHPPGDLRLISRLTLGIAFGVSSVLVLLRIFTRLWITKAFRWDDYFIILAWLLFIPYSTIGFISVNLYTGVHQWNVPLSQFFTFLKLANIVEIIYIPIVFLTKLSIFLQYHRIFCPERAGITYYIIWAFICLNFLFYTAIMMVQIMTCRPRGKIWHPYLPGSCLNSPNILMTSAIVNIVSDLSIFILPLFKVWKLQLSRSQKWGVRAIFATGFFACLSSVLRLVNNVRFAHTQDLTWDLTPVALWSLAEVACGIICGCLPEIPIFFKRAGPILKSTLASIKF